MMSDSDNTSEEESEETLEDNSISDSNTPELRRRKVTIGKPETAEKSLDTENPQKLSPQGEGWRKKVRRLQTLFLVTFVVGTALLYIGRGIGGWNILLSILIMSVYWLIVRRDLNSYNAKMVFADSFYYLGFLFTFVALLIALLDLSSSDPIAIIGQMGPALASTIYGMLIRIYLTQFDAIVTEPDQESLAQLGQLAERLSETNDKFLQSQEITVQTMQSFSDKIKELDVNTTVENLKNLDSSLGKIRDDVDKADKTFSDVESKAVRLGTNLSTLNSRMESLENPSEQINKVETIVKNQIKNIETTVQSISSELNTSAGKVKTNLEETDKNFEYIKNQAGIIQDSFDKFLKAFLKKMENRK